jgi:hypothetical protein
MSLKQSPEDHSERQAPRPGMCASERHIAARKQKGTCSFGWAPEWSSTASHPKKQSFVLPVQCVPQECAARQSAHAWYYNAMNAYAILEDNVFKWYALFIT